MYQNKKINQDEFTKRLCLLSKNQLDELITVAQRKGISQADIQAGLKSIQQISDLKRIIRIVKNDLNILLIRIQRMWEDV